MVNQAAGPLSILVETAFVGHSTSKHHYCVVLGQANFDISRREQHGLTASTGRLRRGPSHDHIQRWALHLPALCDACASQQGHRAVRLARHWA